MRDENLKSAERVGSSIGRITWKFESKKEVTLRNKGEKENKSIRIKVKGKYKRKAIEYLKRTKWLGP
jgi:hypothetical protein